MAEHHNNINWELAAQKDSGTDRRRSWRWKREIVGKETATTSDHLRIQANMTWLLAAWGMNLHNNCLCRNNFGVRSITVVFFRRGIEHIDKIRPQTGNRVADTKCDQQAADEGVQ
jgi:hypothetical protein